jgi:hypothetical protein
VKTQLNGRLTKNTLSFVTATCAVVIGLSACGKFSAIDPNDPKAKGTSTKANPLAADEENRLRDLKASGSPTPSPSPGQSPTPRTADGNGDPDRLAALDKARQVFDAELGPGQPGAPAAPGAPPAPAAAAAAQPASSKALIAEDVSDETKRDLIIQLIEPAMRINFALSWQRNEILEMQKILDSKQELSAEQAAKLSKFKQSFLLVDADSIDALLSRVDVVNMILQIAPSLLTTHWQAHGQISDKEISKRVEILNTDSSDQAVRFRSGRLEMQAMQASTEKNTSKQIMLFELGHDPEAGKDELSEKMLATIEEAHRIIGLYQAEIDKMTKDTYDKLVSENTKK